MKRGVVKDRTLSEGHDITIFWVLTLCDLVLGYRVSEECILIFCNEDGGNVFLRKVNNGLVIWVP